MPNGTYGGVRDRNTKVGRKLVRFPPTRFAYDFLLLIIEFEEQSRHRFVLSMYCKINRLTKQLTKLFKV